MKPPTLPTVRRNSSGFTLVELLVVIVIVACLAGIVIKAVALAHGHAP